MNETAVILPQHLTAESFRELVTQRGRLEDSRLIFDDGAYLYVSLCHPEDAGLSPEAALDIGQLEYGDLGNIILIGSSKYPDHRKQLASSIVALIGGHVISDD